MFESRQERLDPLPQLRIFCALTVEDGSARRPIVAFDGRQKHSLNALRVELHRTILEVNQVSLEGEPPGGRTSW